MKGIEKCWELSPIVAFTVGDPTGVYVPLVLPATEHVAVADAHRHRTVARFPPVRFDPNACASVVPATEPKFPLACTAAPAIR
jgi:hypothetical protein